MILPAPHEEEGSRWPILAAQPNEPRGETYLRLLEIDLDEPQAILEFVSQHGVLGGARAYRALRQFPDYEPQLNEQREWRLVREALTADLAIPEGHFAAAMLENGEFRFAETVAELGRRPGARVATLVDRLPFVETLDEFRFAARVLHDATWAWRVFHEALDPIDIDWRAFPADYRLASLGDVERLLTWVLPAMLARFAPQLDVSSPPHPGGSRHAWDPPQEATVTPSRTPHAALLYELCALELFNHITEGAKYRVCQNEPCGKLFVRQQGRAEHGQHRTKGVRYCSMDCARAQAQREYRRRRKAENASAGRGAARGRRGRSSQ